MRVLMWSLLGFVAGLLLGYFAVIFGWVGYSLYARIGDVDGGKLMGIVFLAAPLGGLAGGLIGAFWFALRAARRHERVVRSGLARAAE
jgi:membrane associated rhomboid family serine protease